MATNIDATTDLDEEGASHSPPLTLASARWLWPVLLIIGVSAFALAAMVIDEIAEGGSFKWDSRILLAMRRPGHPDTPIGPVWLTQSATDLSALGGFTLQWLLGSGAIAFLLHSRRRAEAGWLAASVLGASFLNAGLKLLFHRARPEVVPHLARVDNASFPSGHAMISAAILFTTAAMLSEAQPRSSDRVFLMGFAAVLVVLIGCSRIYLGVHWPSDVLAGWCLGVVWALVVFAANRALRRQAANKPMTTTPASSTSPARA